MRFLFITILMTTFCCMPLHGIRILLLENKYFGVKSREKLKKFILDIRSDATFFSAPLAGKSGDHYPADIALTCFAIETRLGEHAEAIPATIEKRIPGIEKNACAITILISGSTKGTPKLPLSYEKKYETFQLPESAKKIESLPQFDNDLFTTWLKNQKDKQLTYTMSDYERTLTELWQDSNEIKKHALAIANPKWSPSSSTTSHEFRYLFAPLSAIAQEALLTAESIKALPLQEHATQQKIEALAQASTLIKEALDQLKLIKA